MAEMFASWKVRCATSLALLIVLGSAISTLVNGAENMRDVFAWAIWAYERANTPWLGVFMLLLVGWLLWSGLRDIRSDAEKHKEAKRIALAEETVKRAALIDDLEARFEPHFSFINDLKRLAINECQLNELTSHLREGERSINDARRLIDQLPNTSIQSLLFELAPFDHAWRTLSLQGSILGLSNPIPEFAPLPTPVSRNPAGMFAAMYDPEKNGHYEAALRHRLAQLEAGRNKLAEMVEECRNRQGRVLQRIGIQYANTR